MRFPAVFILLVVACSAPFAVEAATGEGEMENSQPSPQTCSSTSSSSSSSGGTDDSAPSPSPSSQVSLKRFPLYGTREFDELCPWAVTSTKTDTSLGYREGDCTLLVRPGDRGNEGIADWLADVAGGAIHAVQTGCHLTLDYGFELDIGKVLKPVDESPAKNWTVPSKFAISKDCAGSTHNCHRMTNKMSEKRLKRVASSSNRRHGPPASPVALPSFRFAYSQYFNQGKAHDMEQYKKTESSDVTLPNFRFEAGMACALGSTLQFSPEGAAEFVPNIREIWKAVHDEEALVIAIYLRTGQTDEHASHERKVKNGEDAGAAPIDSSDIFGLHAKAIRCAEQVESDWLSRPMHRTTKKRSVWMVTSDSPNLCGKVVERFSDKEVDFGNERTSVTRKVFTTGAKGRQTRTARSPLAEDFAVGKFL